jgi:hypothetical protein
MRLAAGGALVAVKHIAVEPVNKVKIVPVENKDFTLKCTSITFTIMAFYLIVSVDLNV